MSFVDRLQTASATPKRARLEVAIRTRFNYGIWIVLLRCGSRTPKSQWF